MSQQFFDHFAEASKSVQERLGTSRVTINRESAVLGTQTRSLVQMLNYGLDAMTVRAATHLLNFHPLRSNTAYLMRLMEGLLLNSIESITPPHLPFGKALMFETSQAYSKWSIVGTCSLLDGTPANLVVYKDPEPLPAQDGKYRYNAFYCAGAYVHQSVPITSLDFTPGTHQSLLIPERYKSVWTDSVEVSLVLDNGQNSMKLEPHWSFDDLLAASDLGKAVLCQHTARGITITLGDGEVFGQDYNKRKSVGAGDIIEVSVSYIKCDSLADVNQASVSFNGDIEILGDIATMTKSKSGDTAESLRVRAIAEFFAAGKITDEKDMETELKKIPIVKSAHCKREYNYPLGMFKGDIASLRKSIPTWEETKSYTAGAFVRSDAPAGFPTAEYAYFCVGEPAPGTRPATSPMWFPMFPIDSQYTSALRTFASGYPSYQVYDNATLVVTGLVLKSRHYYREDKAYAPGDVVYYPKTDMVYKAALSTFGVAPDDEPTEAQFPWVSAEDMISDPAFDAYEEITPAIFELELKHYFGIWQKLGFCSVVVEPLDPIKCKVECSYSSPYPLNQDLQDAIAAAVCWNVGAEASAEALNSELTEKFSLAAVNVSIKYYTLDGRKVLKQVEYNQYVRRSALEVTLKEI